MPTFNIDGKDYDTDLMSADAKAQLTSVQFVDAELQRLGFKTAAMQTARAAYFNALKQALIAGVDLGADTIKLG